MIKVVILGKIRSFLAILEKNRASRRPYKAPDFLKSRGTALFAIFRCRGSSEPTEAFCLCLMAKIGLKMAKIGILGTIFVLLE